MKTFNSFLEENIKRPKDWKYNPSHNDYKEWHNDIMKRYPHASIDSRDTGDKNIVQATSPDYVSHGHVGTFNHYEKRGWMKGSKKRIDNSN